MNSISNYSGYVDPDFSEEQHDVIDPLWEKQQKTTFTAWCNSHLRKVNQNIEVIEQDFRDGLKLMQLLEVISGEKLPKPDKGKMRVHKITNVNKCLDFIAHKGVKLAYIGSEEIVDGNVKMTLGMIWTIILRFAIQDIKMEDLSAKEGLLLWCQRKTAPYKNVKVSNFHTSFKDGLAFCALIHRHRPDLIDYNNLNRENPRENLNLAFDVAEKHLDIPRMLDAEDMIKCAKPDELSVMAYVSSYYHAFSGAQKAETASNRICKVLGVNQENEKLMNEYDKLSTDLLQWIEKMIPIFQDRSESTSVENMHKKLENFRKYRISEKPPKHEEKGQLETAYNTLQTRLRLSNRPNFIPPEGKTISEIGLRWKDLEKSEKDFEEWLMSELQRLEQLDYLVRRFHLRCNTHESWSNGKVEMLKSEDYLNANLAELRALYKRLQAFESDFSGHEPRVVRINVIAEELRKLEYHDMKTIDARLNSIVETWDYMSKLDTERNNNIKTILQLLENIDSLHLDFAKKVPNIYNWIEQAKEDLQDSFMVHYIDEVKALLDQHNQFKESLKDATNEYDDLMSISKNINRLAQENHLGKASENPYTMVTAQNLHDEWEELNNLVPKRGKELQEELTRQEQHENLRLKYAKLANIVGPWLEARQERLNSLSNNVIQASLEEQKSELYKLEQEVMDFRPKAEELDQYSQELHKALIFENRNTAYSMEILRVSWEQMLASIRKTRNEIDNQILTRNSKGLSVEQMEEFRRCFNHFDKDHTRMLEPNEFKACLVSLGYNLKEDRDNQHGRRASVGEADFSRIMLQVDPNNDGYVTFDAFIDFMTHETADEDSSDQILRSFKVLAGDKDYITEEELRRELPKDQAEYCIANMAPYTGPSGDVRGYDYQSFSNSLYGLSDL